MSARLPSMSSREVCEALHRANFSVRRTHGSHLILSNGRRSVTVPAGRKDVHEQLLAMVLKNAGISKSEFAKLLRG